MGSKNPPRNLYDPALLASIEQAFDASWTMLQVRDPFRDFDKDNDVKSELSHELMGLAAEGVTDPIELREWALESLGGYR